MIKRCCSIGVAVRPSMDGDVSTSLKCMNLDVVSLPIHSRRWLFISEAAHCDMSRPCAQIDAETPD